MERKTNIPRPYSAMKKTLFSFLAFAAMCLLRIDLSAQNITASYDYETQTLTIANSSEKLIQIYEQENMPADLVNYIRDNGVSDNGKTKLKIQGKDKEDPKPREKKISIDSSEMLGFDTIEVAFFIGEFVKDSVIEVCINKQVKPQAGEAGSLMPFLQTPFVKMLLSDIRIIIGVAIGLLVIVILILLTVVKRKKKKKNDSKQATIIQVIEEEKTEYTVGLSHVHQDAANYFVLEMKDFFMDTAVKKVYVARDVIRSLNTYFKTFLENPERTHETGCYLVGCWEEAESGGPSYNISLEAIVRPEDDAVYDEYSLNFGLKIGVKLGSTLRNLAEKTGRDYVHTAWMHSHPGLGLFLSSHDLIVQKQLAYSDAPQRMVAIVIDTNTPDWQMSVFTAKSNGVMNNKEDMLKTVSFDILKEWCRNPSARPVTEPAVSLENTFVVKSEDEKDWFSFSAKAINLIDDVLFAEIPATGCFLTGQIQKVGDRRVRIVNFCETASSEGTLGCLCTEKENMSDIGAYNYKDVLAKFDFCLVYRSEQQSLIIYKNEKNEMNLIQTSLKEMKEWTRRKRI